MSFVLTNTSSADRYLLTAADQCHPFIVDDLQPEAVQQRCDGVDAGSGGSTFIRLSPGASWTFTWGGREAVEYTTHVNCGDPSWFDFGNSLGACCDNSPYACAEATLPVLRLVPSGTHVAAFGVADAVPSCLAGADAAVPDAVALEDAGAQPDAGTFTCPGGWTGWAGRCPPSLSGGPSTTVTATFDLPASGPLTVTVPIP